MKTTFSILFFLGLITLTSYSQNTTTLLQPYDKDTIKTIYPIFNWSSTDFGNQRANTQYIFTLVELNNNQSANAGLLVNTPLLRINNIQGSQFSYPFDAPELKFNHRYGWKLQKVRNGTIVSESESWEFTLYKDEEFPKKYAVLSSSNTSTTYMVENNEFYFKFMSRYGQGDGLKFILENSNSEIIPVEINEDQKKGKNNVLESTGKGFYFLNTEGFSSGVYTLTVQDQKRNNYSTRFRIK